jgi:sulfur dioxygenase
LIKKTFTYTYLLGDSETREAVIIDPVLERTDRDLKLIEELGLKLKYILDTHVHADHITGSSDLKKATGAKIVLGENTCVDCADILLKDGNALTFGSHTLKGLSTPGHTEGCMSFYTEGMVFTGDALFIRGTGRTDFQGGSSETLFESITEKLFTLPDDTIIYPGHDYRGVTLSYIGEEKQFNPRVGAGISKGDFVAIMESLNLPNPKKIHEAVPANQVCGARVIEKDSIQQ